MNAVLNALTGNNSTSWPPDLRAEMPMEPQNGVINDSADTIIDLSAGGYRWKTSQTVQILYWAQSIGPHRRAKELWPMMHFAAKAALVEEGDLPELV
jgi:hypothetical protein